MLPAEYAALGATPRPWTLGDTAAEAYLLIAQFTVAGDGEQFQSDILGRLHSASASATVSRCSTTCGNMTILSLHDDHAELPE